MTFVARLVANGEYYGDLYMKRGWRKNRYYILHNRQVSPSKAFKSHRQAVVYAVNRRCKYRGEKGLTKLEKKRMLTPRKVTATRIPSVGALGRVLRLFKRTREPLGKAPATEGRG